MQPVDMGDQLHFARPPTEGETEHLIRTFGRRVLDPQADQQAGDQGHIDLEAYAIETLAEQMATPQDTFEPTEKQFNVIVTSHKIRMVRPSRVAILQRTRPPRP